MNTKTLLPFALTLSLAACGADRIVVPAEETSSSGGESSTTLTTGDGDPAGDGDGDPSGDGDGDTAGDGDGEGECQIDDCESNACVEATCEEWMCTYEAIAPCPEFDEHTDIELQASVIAHDPKLAAYLPGNELRIYGEYHSCDQGCPYWQVVRDGATGELLAAGFGRNSPDPEALEALGSSTETWLEPLTLVVEDQDYCEVMPACDDDSSWIQRATFDLIHEDLGLSRQLDSTIGWAAGGFSVSVGDWQDGEVDCVYPAPTRAVVFRDACVDDCPAPSVVDSCEPAIRDLQAFDKLRLEVLPDAPFPLGDGVYDAQCVVLETELTPGFGDKVDIDAELDCVFDVVPTIL